jgi:DNA-binding NarL/FixJ family response regulator
VNSAVAGVDRFGIDVPNQARLLLDLQRVNKIAQRLSGCLDVDGLARTVTDGLVDQFNCAFARIWIVEPDQTSLKLVASSGLYTHTDGSFARVPMGAYKVGKIAQNRVPFLSNRLAEEAWVKDRDWAIANQIQGFAGYPLMTGDRVIGVLATFSHSAMAPEFLEVLQVICMTATIALDAALKTTDLPDSTTVGPPWSLSDQLASILTTATMALVGTEVPLPASLSHAFICLAELLNEVKCDYSRLVYSAEEVALEAIVAIPPGAEARDDNARTLGAQWRSRCHQIRFIATCLGGSLRTEPGPQQQMVQVTLQVPYPSEQSNAKVILQCDTPLLQGALTALAYRAGLTVCDPSEPEAILITDSEVAARGKSPVLWVQAKPSASIPPQVSAVIDWSIDATQLRQMVQALGQGQPVEPLPPADHAPRLSEREQVIIALLAKGLRDRDIANRLYISESTVKFHINNSLAKLQAKNRYQAVYQAAIQGWI